MPFNPAIRVRGEHTFDFNPSRPRPTGQRHGSSIWNAAPLFVAERHSRSRSMLEERPCYKFYLCKSALKSFKGMKLWPTATLWADDRL